MTCKQGYWFGQQQWSHVFFAHWPVSKYSLQPYIPYPFQLDTFNNTAWLTIVAFQASASRLRFVPRLLSFRPFWQINIRTYIRFGKERGIYFLTLYSNDQAAVMLGKIPGLPYCYVPMGITQNENSLLLKSELTV